MRAILSKVVAISMIAGAGLMVTACKTETTATVNNTTEVVVNEGPADEMVGNLDGATGNGTVTETNTTTTNTTTTNAM